MDAAKELLPICVQNLNCLPMLPEMTNAMIYMVFGTFVVAFGTVFGRR